jgi:acyl-CoA thioesterase I
MNQSQTAEKSMSQSEFSRPISYGPWLLFVAGLLTVSLFFSSARAESVRIVALGASNTAGKGAGGSAWPAQLEMMLRAKGYDATVTVNAVNGDTSSGILSRADGAIAPGTRVVVFDLGKDNDRKQGMSEAQTNANKARIAAVIRAHGATPIQAQYLRVVGAQHEGDNANYQSDSIHLTPAAHARIAAALLPRVVAAIGKRK